MSALSDFQIFINYLTSASVYNNWIKSNTKGDGPLWKTFYQEILAGQTPTPPTMNTSFGKALVQVGIIVLSDTPAPPPTTPPAYYGDAEYGLSMYAQV